MLQRSDFKIWQKVSLLTFTSTVNQVFQGFSSQNVKLISESEFWWKCVLFALLALTTPCEFYWFPLEPNLRIQTFLSSNRNNIYGKIAGRPEINQIRLVFAQFWVLLPNNHNSVTTCSHTARRLQFLRGPRPVGATGPFTWIIKVTSWRLPHTSNNFSSCRKLFMSQK